MFRLNNDKEELDFIRFIRLWNILINGDFQEKLKLLFIAHLDRSSTRRENGLNALLEPVSTPIPQSTNDEQEESEGEITKLKASCFPLMDQTEFIQLCKSMYDLMTRHRDEENLFRALTTSSTILLKTGKNLFFCENFRGFVQQRKIIENRGITMFF